MFAIMYETEEGKTFTLCKTAEEAENHANNIACMGYEVTVLEQDLETEDFEEVYTI